MVPGPGILADVTWLQLEGGSGGRRSSSSVVGLPYGP